MNVPEREKLTRFLQQLAQAQPGVKDAEAEKLISEVARVQPDAAYLLVQRSLLLEQALENAQAEIARLGKDLENARGTAGNFLNNNVLNNNAWGTAPAQTPASPRPAATAGAVPASAPAVAASAAFPGSGFLGTVASTAAGVVAGSFLFQGIGNLLGNHGNASGFLSGGNTPTPNALAENTGIDNAHDPDSPASDLELASLGDSDLDLI